jgi:aspartate carbamoyltransferase catalytic subunit
LFLDKSKVHMAKNIIAAHDLSLEEIKTIFSAAHYLSQKEAESQTSENTLFPLLKNKTFVQLFFENSTRTKSSFELAVRRLGGSSLSFTPSQSSTQKGESLIDTAKNIQAMRPDGIIVRHASAGSPYTLSQHLNIPIINAGDGFHEHPTQGLLDVYTMLEKLSSLQGKTVLIVGDIAHSRVARSNIHILKKLGANIIVCGPPTLMPPFPEKIGVRFTYNLDEVLSEADVVMTLRIQFERHEKYQIPSIKEYARFWGLNIKRTEIMKPGAIIMHPGPMNQGVEIDPEVVESGRSVILNQVYNGILIRMATLGFVFYGDKLLDTLKASTPRKEKK